MPDKPYSVKHEGGEELEPKQGHDHTCKPADMGAPLTQEEMAKGFQKLIGGLRLTGLPIQIEDLSKKGEEEVMVEDTDGESAGECVERGYVAERVDARERALGKDNDLKDAFKRIASKGSEINNILDALFWGVKIERVECYECAGIRNERFEAMQELGRKLRGIATEIVTIASSRVTALTPLEDRLGVSDEEF